jgi:hypothetical protein
MTPLMAAAIVSLLAQAPASPHHLLECDAARRDEPTLDRTLAPDAGFRVEERQYGWENGEAAYLPTGIETVTLKSGARATITLSGCEDYSNTYEFELEDSTPLSNGRHWFKTAAALLGEVGAISIPDLPVEFADVQRGLRAQARRQPRFDFRTHEYRARPDTKLLEYNYTVAVKRSGAATILTVVYWVPL